MWLPEIRRFTFRSRDKSPENRLPAPVVLHSAFSSVSHQVDEFGDGDLSDGLLHAAQGVQRRAKAAGQVVSRNGDEIVFAAVQMQHQDVFDGVLARVQQRDWVFTHVHLQINL